MAKQFLVVLGELAVLVGGTDPAQLALLIGQHHPGALSTKQQLGGVHDLLQGGGQVVLGLRVGQAADAGDQRLGVDPHVVVLSWANETIAAAVSLPVCHVYRSLCFDRQPAGAPRRAAGRGALAADQHRTTLALITWGAGLCLVLLPLAIGAAHPALPALNLDQISSRTVAYGLLTLLLAGGYAGIALGLGRLLGRESSPVVAAATLAVVALFQPARGGFKRWSTGASAAAATTPP